MQGAVMIIRLFFLATFICFANVAQAQILLHVPASSCTPDSVTIRSNRHVTANGSVKHAAGNVDKITLICPITPFVTGHTDWVILLTYVDSTGESTAASVRAQLFQMTIGTDTANLIATVTSNLSDETTVETELRRFTHTFAFDGNSYWIRLELSRADASQTVIAYSVALRDFGPSDRRLKHDIELLGRLDNGLGFYRFAYNGSDKAWVGVMAQEVQAVMPDAVVRSQDGYLGVFYSRLGFPMQPYEDWLSAGGRLPDVNKH
jgi:hypothetical protein